MVACIAESLGMLGFITLCPTLRSQNLSKQRKEMDTFCVETINGGRERTIGTAPTILNLYKGGLSQKTDSKLFIQFYQKHYSTLDNKLLQCRVTKDGKTDRN